jgi:Transglutaminase-like domain
MLFCLLPRPLGSRPGNRPASASIIERYYEFIGAILAIGRRPALSMAKVPIRRVPSQTRLHAGSWGICLSLVCAAATASAAHLGDLLDQKDLTPEGLARVMADFSFELTSHLQAPEAFLQRKRGDCADFANLASTVLTHHGYTTKLVVVMMSKQTHVVCYVKEAGGFLDYNHRADAHPVIPSDGSLEDIAGKVAGDFRSQWRMASAFRYRESSPVFLDSVFATESSPARSAVRRATEASATAPVAVQAMIN